MAASGFTPIQLYRSATPGAVPTAANLAPGELALNTADQKLFFENASGVVVSIDTANGTVTSVNASGGTTGLTFSGGPITTSGTLTLAGTLAVANGGTGATTLTGVVKGNGTSALTAGTVALASEVSGTLPVANGGTGVTSSTGTVAVVLSNSPTLVTPNLGTPSAATLTNATGLPLSTGVTGTLAVANGGTGVTTSTGTTSVVLSNSPVLVTPTLGAASATSIANGLGAVGTPSYTFTGDTNTGMWSPSADAVAFSTAGAERMRIDSSGNVGIGTATPGASTRLNVTGRGLFTAGSYDPGDSTASGVSISYDTGSNVGIIGAVQTGVTEREMRMRGNTLTFFTNGANERMRVTDAGNVGIGLSNPTDKLEVNGSSIFRGTALFNTSGSAGTNSAAYIRAANALSSATTPDYTWWFNDQCGFFHPAANVIGFTTGGTERMRIDASGNVGIGTTSPATKLHVSAASGYNEIRVASGANNLGLAIDGSVAYLAAFQSMPLTFQTNSTERMRITSGGDVGIGTSSPGKKLDVVGQFRVSNTAASGYALLEYGTSATATNNWHVGSEGDGTFRWYNGNFGAGTERMRITSAGNVGIGTSSPTAKLDVVGNASFGAAITTGTGLSTGDAQLEVGGNRSGNGPAYMDLHAVAGGDFSARVLRTGGTNGNMEIANAGTGVLTIATNGTERMRITSAGKVGIGTSSPDATAILDVSSTTAGFLPPRMSTAERDAIGSGAPQEGLILYNVTTDKLQVFSAGAWVNLH